MVFLDLAGVAAVLTAAAAWRKAGSADKKLKTANGQTVGQIMDVVYTEGLVAVAQTAKDVKNIDGKLDTHISLPSEDAHAKNLSPSDS